MFAKISYPNIAFMLIFKVIIIADCAERQHHRQTLVFNTTNKKYCIVFAGDRHILSTLISPV